MMLSTRQRVPYVISFATNFTLEGPRKEKLATMFQIQVAFNNFQQLQFNGLRVKIR